ncbi:ABC-three component system middle component 4 [Bacillus spizizenii]|uniref:ABC-three component system middle component 4 n=1 Tax=Bacillus spizizenii TaxID=96241 RepID=UPI0018E2AACC|nr:ABC-three component system middle component 4 [Bacillus spizizenii]
MIIDQLAYTQRGKLVINIDRLVIFDFLIRNPFILKQVLSIKNNKTNLRLLRYEFETVSTLFPNKIALVDTKSTKEIIKLMIAYKMLKVFQEKDDLFYVLTDKAKLIVNQIDTDYSVRVKELCEAMLVLRSVTINDLKKVINPLVKGI